MTILFNILLSKEFKKQKTLSRKLQFYNSFWERGKNTNSLNKNFYFFLLFPLTIHLKHFIS